MSMWSVSGFLTFEGKYVRQYAMTDGDQIGCRLLELGAPAPWRKQRSRSVIGSLGRGASLRWCVPQVVNGDLQGEGIVIEHPQPGVAAQA